MFSARNRRAEDNGCGITMAAVPYSIHPSRNVVCVFYLFFFFFERGREYGDGGGYDNLISWVEETCNDVYWKDEYVQY